MKKIGMKGKHKNVFNFIQTVHFFFYFYYSFISTFLIFRYFYHLQVFCWFLLGFSLQCVLQRTILISKERIIPRTSLLLSPIKIIAVTKPIIIHAKKYFSNQKKIKKSKIKIKKIKK